MVSPFEPKYPTRDSAEILTDAIRISRRIEVDLQQLGRHSRRFDWKSHQEDQRTTVLWRGNTVVGSFEWAGPEKRRALATIHGVDLVCARGHLNWMAVEVRSAQFGGSVLRSLAPRWRGRVLRWQGANAYRWFFDPYSRWYWVTDMDRYGVISFRPPQAGMRDLDGIEMWVAKDHTGRPESPFLMAVGWFLLATPFGGFPWVPRVLRKFI